MVREGIPANRNCVNKKLCEGKTLYWAWEDDARTEGMGGWGKEGRRGLGAGCTGGFQATQRDLDFSLRITGHHQPF